MSPREQVSTGSSTSMHAHSRRGRADKEEEIQRALKRARSKLLGRPNDPQAYVDAAEILYSVGSVDKAKAALEKAKSLAAKASDVTLRRIGKLIDKLGGLGLRGLPDELLAQILGHLSTSECARLQIVCKRWRRTIRESPQLWSDIVVKGPIDSKAVHRVQMLNILSRGRPRTLYTRSASIAHFNALCKDLLSRINCKSIEDIDINVPCDWGQARLPFASIARSLQKYFGGCKLKKFRLNSEATPKNGVILNREADECDRYVGSLPFFESAFSEMKTFSIFLNTATQPSDFFWRTLTIAQRTIEEYSWFDGIISAPPRRAGDELLIHAPRLKELLLSPQHMGDKDDTAQKWIVDAPLRSLTVSDVGLRLLEWSLHRLLSPHLHELRIIVGPQSSSAVRQLCEHFSQCDSLNLLEIYHKHAPSLVALLNRLVECKTIPVTQITIIPFQEEFGESLVRLVHSRLGTISPLRNVRLVGEIRIQHAEYLRQHVEAVSISTKCTSMQVVLKA